MRIILFTTPSHTSLGAQTGSSSAQWLPRERSKASFAIGPVVFVLAYGGGSVTDLHRLPSGPEKHATIADNDSRICKLQDAPAALGVSAIGSGTVK